MSKDRLGPPVRVEIAAGEWQVFMLGLSWAIRRSYVDHVTLGYSALVEEALLAASKKRRTRDKTPAVLELPRSTLDWTGEALIRASRDAKAKVNYFNGRTTKERRAFMRNAGKTIERLKAENKKTVIDLIGDLG